jgi:hypothetical protein
MKALSNFAILFASFYRDVLYHADRHAYDGCGPV